MTTAKKLSGLLLATAAASMFALAPMAAHAGKEDVKCVGGNGCKGQGSCKTATNACKGQNACKGKGFVMAKNAAECTKAGGKVEMEKKS